MDALDTSLIFTTVMTITAVFFVSLLLSSIFGSKQKLCRYVSDHLFSIKKLFLLKFNVLFITSVHTSKNVIFSVKVWHETGNGRFNIFIEDNATTSYWNGRAKEIQLYRLHYFNTTGTDFDVPS